MELKRLENEDKKLVSEAGFMWSATAYLLEKILEKNADCIIFSPISPFACQAFRENMSAILDKKSKKSKLRTKEGLNEAVKYLKSRSLETRDNLAKLADQNVELLKAYAENLDKILKITEENAKNIDDKTWKDVRDVMIDYVNDKNVEKKQKKLEKECEINALEGETELKPFHVIEV